MAYTTINKSTDYFNTKLYTGTGSTRSVTGVGFKPDFTWIKNRVKADSNHFLLDIVRGATKYLHSDADSSETTNPNTLTSFDSDGFSLGDLDNVNKNNNTLVSWNWLAGGSQGSSNTAGSINTTYTSVNTTAGFSISSYTGSGANATIGHGLGVTPNVVLVKCLSSTGNWKMHHTSLAPITSLNLNDTSAQISTASVFNSMATLNSNVFSVGTEGDTNSSGLTYVAYCFAEKQGYSKMGIYTGNGNPDGPFIYTGFAPAWVLCKSVSGSGSPGGNDWNLLDNKMTPYNMHVNKLFPNTSGVENTSAEGTLDMVSNGFKPRGTGGSEKNNNSGTNYIYMAFGQSIVGTNGVTAKAR